MTTNARVSASAPQAPEGSDRPADRSLAWQSLPLAGSIGIFGLTGAGTNTTMSLFLANAVHVAPFLIGLFFTARAAAGIVAGLVTGWISDRMPDRRVVLGLTSLGGAAGAASLALTHNYLLLLVTCVIFTSIGSGAYGQLFAYANEFATERGRDVTAFSSLMRSVFSAAYVVGAPLCLALMARFGFGPLYAGVAVLTLAIAVIGRWGLHRTAPAAVPAQRGPRERRGAWQTIRGTSLPARLWLLLGVIVVLGMVNQMFNIDISLHITKDLHLSAQLVGWVLGLTAAVEIPVMIVAGRAARRVGSGRLVGVSAAVAVVSFCLVPLATTPLTLLGIAVLFGVWQGVALSIPMVMVQTETPGGLGVASSLYGAAFGTSGLVAGAVTGVTAAAVGYGGVLWVCAGLAGLAAAGMLGRRTLALRARPAGS